MNDPGVITRCYSLRYERTSKHSAARLWRAITDSDEVGEWMRFPARIDARPGGDYFVDMSGADGTVLDGTVIRAEPGVLLRYAWGTSVVEWRIHADGDGCHYTFIHAGITPRGIPDEEGLAAGWHSFLEDLHAFLAGVPGRVEPESARWIELCGLYRPLLEEVLGSGVSAP